MSKPGLGSWSNSAMRTLLFAALAGSVSAAHAQTLTTLHTFSGNPDGAQPAQTNLLDANGTLYGTTAFGGLFGWGTIFKLTSSGEETILYNFTGGSDGAEPLADLKPDKDGNLYGTALFGGDLSCSIPNEPPGCGTTYELEKNGKFSLLYTFTGAVTGALPQGVIFDPQGNLYGITLYGGDNANCFPPVGCGLVYELNPATKIQTIIFTFTFGPDGATPNDFLIMDHSGNLYGVTVYGGNIEDCAGLGCGIVFKLTPNGQETVLYTFTGGADGAEPNGDLLMDVKGDLYGTTFEGGDLTCTNDKTLGCGVVFEVTPAGKEIVLHTFKGPDGANPLLGLVADAQGNGYGTTYYGGADNLGAVFQLNPKRAEKVLHSFTGAADGGTPDSGLTIDKSGNLYGNTQTGGDLSCNPPNGCGTVFKLVP